jgi:hypothetical protein
MMLVAIICYALSAIGLRRVDAATKETSSEPVAAEV